MNWDQLLQLALQMGENTAGGFLGQPVGLGDYKQSLNDIASTFPEFKQLMEQSAGEVNPLLSQYLAKGSPYLARLMSESQDQTAQQFENARQELAQRLAGQGFGAGKATGGTIAASEGELARAEANTGAQNFLQNLLANEGQRFAAANDALQEASLFNPANFRIPTINSNLQSPLAHLFDNLGTSNSNPLNSLATTGLSALAKALGGGATADGLSAATGSGGVLGSGLTLPGFGGDSGIVGAGSDGSLLSTVEAPFKSAASGLSNLGALGTAGLGAGIGGLIGAFDPGYGGIGKAGSSGIDAGLTAALGALGGPVGLGAGALASVIAGMFKGANPNQVPMANIRQTFDAAGDDIRHAAASGYISPDQMKSLLNLLSTQGVSSAQKALGGFSNVNDKMRSTGTDIQGDLSALMSKPLGTVSSQPFDWTSVRNSFVNPNTPGWYSDAVSKGNDLATKLLGSLNV